MLKSFIVPMAVACLCTVNPFAHAQAESNETEPINVMCPIGKEPVVPGAGTVEYKGKAIGLCCPGCGKQFLTWDGARKDEFVALAVAHNEPDHDRHAGGTTDAEPWTDSFSLDTCPVSGGKLGSMGDPVLKVYDGREVRFCCAGCIGKFEADQEGYWKAIDKQIVKDQIRYYPTETCIVSGEPLFENGEDIAANVVYGNRLVRLCCKMCEREFKADSKKFIDELDEVTADAQRTEYPLATCVVAGGALGSMGEPTEMVVAGRLMRFCCAGCEPKVKADPVKYIAEIDEAWQVQGKFMPTEREAHEGGRSHGDHDHGG
ncbi:MAG: hypothetical protein ED559_04125 [Phycisphaera sp.]|nr:MAG: hypothetical protein ED559_04125 [Phycisphaera sp.]